MKRYLRIIFILWNCVGTLTAQNLLRGLITDHDGEPIVMAHVYYEDQKMNSSSGAHALSDADGRFEVPRREGHTLHVTFMGFKPKEILIDTKTPRDLNIVMDDDTQTLGEVTIKAKDKRYRRKDNPAVELMRRVIAAKRQTDLENHDYLQYNKYQKITLSLNDVKPGERTELSPYNNKEILPLSMEETVTQRLYRKSPRKRRDIIQGENSDGLTKMFATGDMVGTTLKDVFQDVDIYQEYVRLLQYPFLSPIAPGATSFYRFYIQDTVRVGQDSCYHLRFLPNNQQDFGFSGDLWVLTDSTLHMKRCSLSIPKKSDVNFVDKMHIDQEFVQLDNGEWVLDKDDMWAEMKLLNKSMLVVRNTRLSDYAFDPLPKKLFKGRAEVRHLANARGQDEEFWARFRQVELTEKEASFDDYIAKLENSRRGRATLFVLKPILENYIETGKTSETSKLDIGPVLNMFSQNYVDGFRTTLGARTSANLSPQWFWKGYVAHGFKSHKTYYSSEVTYSFNKKKNSPFEFTQRTLAFESTYDVMSPTDKFLTNNKDNILVGIRTQAVKEMYFFNRQKLTFTWENEDGLAFLAYLKAEGNQSAGAMKYMRYTGELDEAGMPVTVERDRYRTTEATLTVKFCPGQTYINTKQQRLPINLDSPEFRVSHTFGLNHFLGGQYTSNLTELGVYKRQWLGSWGHIDMNLDAAVQWNKVPFFLLIMPPTNLSYIQQDYTFEMLSNMEFWMDRKLQWRVYWDLNGKILNRIPLLKRLKWREHVAFRGIWGQITDKNNPFLPENYTDADLYQFPAGSRTLDSATPYMEYAVGIHNVLKVFSCDWVHRINYLGKGIASDGVRFGLNLTF